MAAGRQQRRSRASSASAGSSRRHWYVLSPDRVRAQRPGWILTILAALVAIAAAWLVAQLRTVR